MAQNLKAPKPRSISISFFFYFANYYIYFPNLLIVIDHGFCGFSLISYISSENNPSTLQGMLHLAVSEEHQSDLKQDRTLYCLWDLASESHFTETLSENEGDNHNSKGSNRDTYFRGVVFSIWWSHEISQCQLLLSHTAFTLSGDLQDAWCPWVLCLSRSPEGSLIESPEAIHSTYITQT